MPTGHPLDENQLHHFLWVRADRRGAVRVDQGELANLFGVTKHTISRKFAALTEAGKIQKVSRFRNNRGLFVITNPNAFIDDDWMDEGGEGWDEEE